MMTREGGDMAPYCDEKSPPSPPSASTTTPQLFCSPNRIRDSACRPRRSLLSLHFLSDEETSGTKASYVWQQHQKQQKHDFVPADEVGHGQSGQLQDEGQDTMARAQLSPFRDGLSRSLPSPPVSAFLEQREDDKEESPEPASPPEVTPFHPPPSHPPLAPKKGIQHRVVRQGKHRPRCLIFEEGESSGTDGTPSSLPATTMTPLRQPFSRDAPTSITNPTKRRIQMRDLR